MLKPTIVTSTSSPLIAITDRYETPDFKMYIETEQPLIKCIKEENDESY